jgi:hypothetical protein
MDGQNNYLKTNSFKPKISQLTTNFNVVVIMFKLYFSSFTQVMICSLNHIGPTIRLKFCQILQTIISIMSWTPTTLTNITIIRCHRCYHQPTLSWMNSIHFLSIMNEIHPPLIFS